MKSSKMLPIVASDPWLEPYAAAIQGRYDYYLSVEKRLTGEKGSLSDFATGYLYFGLHHTPDGWIFREWAPNATAIFLIGDFNNWQKNKEYQLTKLENGVWEIQLPEAAMKHLQLYKLIVEWEGGSGERIPAWARRVIQDEHTKIFSAQVWNPENPFQFKVDKFVPDTKPLLIYECHIGMSSSEGRFSGPTTSGMVV